MTTVIAIIGAKSLYLLYGWLFSAIGAAWLSERKGYGDKLGLAFGLLLFVPGLIAWLLWPPRPDSKWKLQGPLPFGEGGKTVAEARAEQERANPGDDA